MSRQVRRLLDSFAPEQYDLNITLHEKKFEGLVTITGLKKQRPSQRLTLHAKDLKVTKATLIHHTKNGDQEIKIDRINHQAKFDEVRLHAKQLLHAGKYSLSVHFAGTITKPMNGLYPCFFKHDGKQKQLLATQFESHHAREVFPCIDEPAAKATFDLTLITKAGHTVLANTPAKEVSTKASKTTTSFETTPKMSTYLLAFAVGELGYLEAKTKRGVVVRTYATPDQVKHTQFALDVAVKTLDFYEDYFAIDYPLPKLDMIALPDFASGAMENWGLVTYREQTMLVDPKNSSLSIKQYVAMVVAHELAHQWFGNLVTMSWWTDLWLNEGFASWIEFLAVDTLFPDWQMWTQFIVDEQHRGLKLDALEHTHPVEVPVNHPDEIRTIFDTISYSKGASVIHMLYGYLGAKDFQNGLRLYLKNHAYGNTETTDLWLALERASGRPVKKFMHAWTSQPGFPLLQIVSTPDHMHLEQERFYLNPEQPKDTATTWPIPLLSNNKDMPELLKKSEQNVKVKQSLVKFNQGQSGFYRTLYGKDQLEAFGKEIQKGNMSAVDRLGLLSDTFEAAKAGYIPTDTALQLLSSFENEDNNAVWDVMAGAIGSVRSVMDDEDLRDSLKPFVRRLTAKQLKRLGWNEKASDSHFDKLLRPTILGMASLAEEPSVVKEALKRFQATKQSTELHPDIRGVVYGTAVRHGDAATFNKLFTWHEATDSSEERLTLTAALTGFKQPALYKKALKLIQSDSVRLQDASYWIAYSLMNRYAKYTTWEWLQQNWQWLFDNLGSDLSFYRFPIYVANNFSTPEFLAEFNKFFEQHRNPGMERSINQGQEILQWQSAWRISELNRIKQYFATLLEKA